MPPPASKLSLAEPLGLPELPPEVLEMIWEYVRQSLRPRMKRYGMHLKEVRLVASRRIGFVYGSWLTSVYTLQNPPPSRFDDELMEIITRCVFHIYGLPKLDVSLEQGNRMYIRERRKPMTPLAPNFVRWVECLWKHMKEPLVCPEGLRMWIPGRRSLQRLPSPYHMSPQSL